MEFLFPILFFGLVGYFIFMIFTKKGRGMILGGKIVKTIDDEIKQREGIGSTTIRVHVIERKKQIDHSVAIELNQHAYLAWSMMPIKLSKDEARQLISMR